MQMKNYTLFCGSLLLFLCHWQGNAQQEATYTLYRYHMNILNPAVTGTQGAPYLNMSLRSQWVGVEDAPETQAISVGLPHKNNKRLGTGFTVVNDKSFVENNTQFFLDFSYHLPLAKERSLFLGLKAGGTTNRLTAASLKTYGSSSADPLFFDNSSFIPNVGVGVYYHSPNYFLSVSMPRLLNTERYDRDNGQLTQATDRPHVYVTTGFTAELDSSWTFNPSVLLGAVAAAPIDFLMDARFTYKENWDIGVHYTNSGGIGGTTAFRLPNGMQFGYAYVTGFQDQVSHFSKGTHELFLKIKLGNGPAEAPEELPEENESNEE